MSRPTDGAPELAELAGALADRTRASFCLALLDGRAWTAAELARHAGVARSTASEHLDRLVSVGLLAEERQGRHRYLRLAGPDTADLVEHLSSHAPPQASRSSSLRQATAHAALARARTCYDHLAGRLGVSITDAMLRRGLLDEWAVTPRGLRWLSDLGIDVDAAQRLRRPFARGCLDWTERRPHLAGAAGAALCRRFFDAAWLERIGSGRAVRLTPSGQESLRAFLGDDFA